MCELINTSGSIASILAFVCGGSLVQFVNTIRQKCYQKNKFKTGGLLAPDFHVDGLICIVSQSKYINGLADAVRPKYLGLITSNGEPSLSAEKEVKTYVASNIKSKIYSVSPVDDAERAVSTKHACEELIRQMRKDGINNIGVDITGGKKNDEYRRIYGC